MWIADIIIVFMPQQVFQFVVFFLFRSSSILFFPQHAALGFVLWHGMPSPPEEWIKLCSGHRHLQHRQVGAGALLTLSWSVLLQQSQLLSSRCAAHRRAKERRLDHIAWLEAKLVGVYELRMMGQRLRQLLTAGGGSLPGAVVGGSGKL